VALNWQGMRDEVGRSLNIYSSEFIALFLGLELGAMSHSLSDWTGSAYKRYQKQGVKGIFPRGKIKKRKTRRNSPSKPKISKSRTNSKTLK
jgi:uncharacterized metal-binding protein